MAYGDKRDYRPIEIWLKRPGKTQAYLVSTTWARTCKETRERYAEKHGYAASDLTANYTKLD